MPYIRVMDGVMQEFDKNGVNLGKVRSLGVNSYSYLERRNWSTGKGTTGPSNPDYTDDLPYLVSQGLIYNQVMMAPFSGAGSATSWNQIVGTPTFKPDNTVDTLGIKPSYWTLVTEFLDFARDAGAGIVACPIWNIPAIPALVGETLEDLKVKNSKSRNYMIAFVAAFSNRYSTHTGISAWMAGQEIGNVVALNYNDIHDILKEAATAIRQNDSLGRMISSGNAAFPHFSPRANTMEWYTHTLIPLINPDPIDCICENIFLQTEYVSSGEPAGSTRPADFTSMSLGYFQAMQRVCYDLKKPYYVASFGLAKEQENILGETVNQNSFRAMNKNMADTGVQLSCFWAWNGGAPMDAIGMNLLNNGERVPVLEALKDGVKYLRNPIKFPLIDSLVPGAPFKTALDFSVNNLTTNGITIPHIAAYESQDVTISFWIKYTGSSGRDFQSLINNSLNSRGWAISELSGFTFTQIWGTMGISINSAGSNNFINNLNKWTQVVITIKQLGGIDIYCNGFLMQQGGPMSESNPYAPNLVGPVVIGRAPNQTTIPSFQMQDFILYDRILSPTEIFDYYGKGIVTNPIGRWKLNGDLLDSSTNNNTAITGVNGQTSPEFVSLKLPSRSPRVVST